MNLTRTATIALLTCTVLLVSAGAKAQARGPMQRVATQSTTVDPADIDSARAAKLAELEDWLGRLVGRFRYEGYVENPGTYSYLVGRGNRVYVGGQARPVQGDGHCAGIGVGAGVHCIINVTWPERSSYQVARIASLAPAMSLFGIDPDILAVRSLSVDGQSIAEAMLGTLHGDTVTFRMGCVNESVFRPCRRVIRIRAPGDSSVIHFSLDVERILGDDGFIRIAGYMFTMRRAPEHKQAVDKGTDPAKFDAESERGQIDARK